MSACQGPTRNRWLPRVRVCRRLMRSSGLPGSPSARRWRSPGGSRGRPDGRGYATGGSHGGEAGTIWVWRCWSTRTNASVVTTPDPTIRSVPPASTRSTGVSSARGGRCPGARRTAPCHRRGAAAVHPAAYVEGIERFCAAGGGHVDADTVLSAGLCGRAAASPSAPGSTRSIGWRRARPTLRSGGPPTRAPRDRHPVDGLLRVQQRGGHRRRARRRGERVLVVDIDAHHGNGTQDVFYERGDVAYVSWHQDPLYPGTGRADQWGRGAGAGSTLNLPMPRGRDRRALPAGGRGGRGSVLRTARDHLAGAVGGLRRPPGGPAVRPGAHVGGLRRRDRRPAPAGGTRAGGGVPRGRLRPRRGHRQHGRDRGCAGGGAQPPRTSSPREVRGARRAPGGGAARDLDGP